MDQANALHCECYHVEGLRHYRRLGRWHTVYTIIALGGYIVDYWCTVLLIILADIVCKCSLGSNIVTIGIVARIKSKQRECHP